MSRDFNPNISIISPFEWAEMPTLYCWLDRIWDSVCDDLTPHSLDEFMEHQRLLSKMRETKTWGIYKDGDLCGYLEAVINKSEEAERLHPAIRFVAQSQIILKRDLWGLKKGAGVALNLGLQAIFAEDIETVYFPIFKTNRPLMELFSHVGASSVGAISPRTQNGEPVETEGWSVSRPEWEKRNRAFLEAQGKEVESAIEVEELAGV